MNVTVISANPLTSLTNAVERDVAKLRETAGHVVGSAFFGTLLKTMRESDLKGSFGHGGRGEEIFEAQLHGVIAERAGVRMQRDLQDALFRQLERQQRLIGALRNGGSKETADEIRD